MEEKLTFCFFAFCKLAAFGPATQKEKLVSYIVVLGSSTLITFTTMTRVDWNKLGNVMYVYQGICICQGYSRGT